MNADEMEEANFQEYIRVEDSILIHGLIRKHFQLQQMPYDTTIEDMKRNVLIELKAALNKACL